MSSLSTLARLFSGRRPLVSLGGLLVWVGLLGLMELSVRKGLAWWRTAGEPPPPIEAILPEGHLLALALVLFPAVLGAFLGQGAVQLLLCPLSWSLPGLRRRLLRGMLLAGAVTSLASAGVMALVGGEPSALSVGALAFLLYGLGATLPEVYLDPWRWMARLLLFLLLVLFLEGGLVWLDAWPWAGTALALAGGVGCLVGLCAARTGRALALAPVRLFHGRFQPDPALGGPRGGPREEPRWVGRAGSGLGLWWRASLHEAYGGGRSSWLRLGAGLALGCAALVALFGYWEGLDVDGSSRMALHHVRGQLWLPGSQASSPGSPGSARIGFHALIFALVFTNARGLGLRCCPLYPLSRRQRARLAFWSSLARGVAFVAMLGIALTLLLVTLGWAGAPPQNDVGLPRYLRVLLLVLAVVPLAQWILLRLVGENLLCERPPLRAYVIVIVLGLLAGQGLEWLADRSIAIEDALPGAAQLGLLLLLLVASQGIFAAALRRHFLRCDL